MDHEMFSISLKSKPFWLFLLSRFPFLGFELELELDSSSDPLLLCLRSCPWSFSRCSCLCFCLCLWPWPWLCLCLCSFLMWPSSCSNLCPCFRWQQQVRTKRSASGSSTSAVSSFAVATFKDDGNSKLRKTSRLFKKLSLSNALLRLCKRVCPSFGPSECISCNYAA